MSPLVELLRPARPERIALRCDGDAWTYAALDEYSARVAAGLATLGIRAGDRVGLWLPNAPAWLVLFFACARLGAIAVSVNTRFRSHEVGDIVARAGCRALAFAPGFRAIDFDGILAGVDSAALAGLEHLVLCETGEESGTLPSFARISSVTLRQLEAAQPAPERRDRADDRCVIFTTSGTTKAPKFVCHDQKTIVRHARDVAQAVDLRREGSTMLQALPLCGVFGFTQAMASLAARCPMIMLPVFDAAVAAATVIEANVTHMNGVDDMIDGMLAARPEARPFPSLRHFGFARFNPTLDDVVARAESRGVCVRGLYGMSECQALYALQPVSMPAAERRKGGGALVSPDARARIRDPETGALLENGEQGELEICGPSLMREYFDDPDATRKAFTDDGYLRTGDLAYLEPDGRFCYVARMGDVMRLGGFLTSPAEIEAVLDMHPEVEASQVVAVEIGGRLAPVAFCLPRGGGELDESAAIEFCRARLSAFKVPARVFSLDAFPTTLSANGTKIQKSKLRDLAYDLAINAD